MQMSTLIPFQRGVLGTLVVIWLLMGGLALAKELNIVTDDEQALEHLQFAVKFETLRDSIGALPPDLFPLSADVRPITLGTSACHESDLFPPRFLTHRESAPPNLLFLHRTVVSTHDSPHCSSGISRLNA